MAKENLTTEIAGSIHANAVDLLRFEAAERARILKMLEELENNIIDRLRRSVGKSELTNARLKALLAQTRDTIKTAYGDISNSNIKELGKVSEASAYSITSAVNEAVGVDVMSVAFTSKQLQSLADQTYMMGRHLEEYWSEAGNKMYTNFTTQMRLGMLQGEGVSELTRRLTGTKAMNYSDGIMNVPRNQAEAIVRTGTVGSANAGRLATYTDNADVLSGVQWVATLDDRVCEICMALDSLMWSLPESGDAEDYGSFIPDGHNQDYPGPTAHISCRCAQIPVVKSFDELKGQKELSLEDQANISATTRESMDGEVSVKSFDDWLTGKPAAFQNELLGDAKAELYRSGKIGVAELTNQSNRPLTADQLLSKYG